MFILYADKTKLSVRQREQMTSGSVNAYTVRFEFSPDWDGLTRVAVFRSDGDILSVLLDDSNECVVPWEVLQKPMAPLETGVYGTRNGGTVLPTVWANLGTIQPGATPGELSHPPTPELWEQDLAEKQDKLTGLPGQVVGFDEEGHAVAQDMPSGGEEGIVYRFGHGLRQEGSEISVDTTENFDGDNTLPITAAAVQSAVGNIEILLETI